MDLKIIEDKLKQYRLGTKQEEENALREIAQAITLCGLARADFFKTCLLYWRLLLANCLWPSTLFRGLGLLDTSTRSKLCLATLSPGSSRGVQSLCLRYDH